MRRFLEFEDPIDDRARWRIDAGFLSSNWRCLWGCGCQGINDDRSPELMQGCCSVGVVFQSAKEAQDIGQLASTLSPERFQFAAEAAIQGIVCADGEELATRIIDGACIMLNRPGFSGGAGCALHLAALDAGEDPIDYKPLTCWKMPIRTLRHVNPDGTIDLTLRAWRREDWGEGGPDMAWWCTNANEAPEAFTAEVPVVISLKRELTRLLGAELYQQVADELLS